MDDGSQFTKQFQGSAAANLVFAIIFIVYRIIDKKFAHSHCSSNTKCCKCDTREDSFSNDNDNKSNAIVRDLEAQIDEIKAKLSESVREVHKKTIQRVKTERSRSTREFEMVGREKIKVEV